MRILVAEDDPVSRKILKIALGKTDHEIIFAEDGLKAWEIFKKESVKIVVTDLIMPQMDGLTLCKKIRSTKKEDYTYIIVLTTKNRKVDMVNVLEGGADDYITKPFDQGELKARLITGERILKREQQYKNMQNTLIESRNKLRVVFDSLDDEITVIDENFKIVSINKTFMRNKSITYEGTIDKVCFLHKDGTGSPYFEEETVSFIKKAFVTGESKVFVQISTTSQNQKIYKEIHCVPIKDNSGNVFQIMIVSRDITSERRRSEEIEALSREVKRAYSEIKEKNDELENTLQKLKTSQAHMIHSEKMASIGQLAAGIAHEINTPIQYVGDNTRFLSEAFSNFSEVYERHIKLLKAIKADEPLVDMIKEVECTTEK
ncbi:MAG: response regulator, partial [Thermodesulfobacteriota bacterium]|nr:response regulator [Thermodesulfobacteriota bacterium]